MRHFPLAFLTIALPVFLREMGLALDTIALIGVVAVPLALSAAQANGADRSQSIYSSIVFAGGGPILLSHYFDWRIIALLGSVLFLVLSILKTDDPLPSKYSAPIRNVFKTPRFAVFASFIFLSKSGVSMLSFVIGPYWIDHGFSKNEFALVAIFFGLVVSAVGFFAGRWILLRVRILWALITLGLLQALSHLGYVLADLSLSTVSVYVASVLAAFGSGLGSAALVRALISVRNVEGFYESRFALFALLSLSYCFFGYLGGVAAATFGYLNFFLMTILIGFAAIPLVFFVRRILKPKIDDDDDWNSFTAVASHLPHS
ncbi:MAG TPA: hypothetical protein VJ521_02495 [Acidobacteriota bacterium]|nr:hypothetical protein [Acidobacteriota bacterium]